MSTRFTVALVVAATLASAIPNATAGSQEGSVQILDPVGGEAWSGIHLVRWADSFAVADRPIHWDLAYSLDLGVNWIHVPGGSGDYRSTTAVTDHSWPFDTRAFADTANAMFRIVLTLTGSGTSTNVVATTADAIAFDNTAPSTTATVTGTAGNAGWLVSNADVRLAATDATSGVAATYLRVDGGVWGARDAIELGEGDHLVDYYGVDRAGNAEAARSVRVLVDTTAPATLHALQGVLGHDEWWRSGVNVALLPSDATSGPAASFARADGAPFARIASGLLVEGDGEHVVDYFSEDVAGNVETARTTRFRIDATPPASTFAIGEPKSLDARGRQYLASGTPIALSTSDATSGVRDLWYRFDDRAFAQYSRPVFLEGADGEHDLEFYAVDRAGNVESLRRLELWLDNTAPSIAITRPLEGSLSVGANYVEAGATIAFLTSLVPATPDAPDAPADVPALPVEVPNVPPPTVDVDREDFTPVMGVVRVEVATSDGDGSGVDRVEYYVDDAIRFVARSGDFAFEWDTTVDRLGEHVLTARAVDELGFARSSSIRVHVLPIGPAGIEATAMDGVSFPSWLLRLAPALGGVQGVAAVLQAVGSAIGTLPSPTVPAVPDAPAVAVPAVPEAPAIPPTLP